MEKTLTYTLRYPIGNTTTITLRRPKARDYIAIESAEGTQADKLVNFLATLAQEDPKLIEDLDGEDFFELEDLLESFLPPRLQAKLTASVQKSKR